MRLAIIFAVLTGAPFAAAQAQAAPTGTDFEQVLPKMQKVSGPTDPAHPEEGRVTSRSPVMDAPAQFDLAGLSGEIRPTEMRARPKGGEWTDWTETADGAPVFFGDSDQLQIRARGWIPQGRVHYVSVEGVADESTTTTAARGTSGMPNVVSRKAWGANKRNGGCKPRQQPEFGKVKAAVVHHTVSAVKYTESQAPGMILAICRFHRNDNGWNDIGYNTLVDRFGNIYEGRKGGLDRPVVGAQSEGWNAQTTGVAMLGTHTSVPISKAAMQSLTKWLAWKLPQHGRSANETVQMTSAGGASNRYPAGRKIRAKSIIGHRKLNSTACPGDTLFRQLGTVREKTQNKISRR